MKRETPLGKKSAWPDRYAPDVLCPLPRRDAREPLGIRDPLPFRGEDIWNAWELTWLGPAGKPVVATAVLRFPADSENLVESKSLKLYLNSLAMSRFGSADEVCGLVENDLSRAAGCRVTVELTAGAGAARNTFDELPGLCIDDLDAECDTGAAVDASLLACAGRGVVSEVLHSHLLRSNCPVTDQPDIGSVLVRYRGAAIDRGALLRYLVSYRCHNAFHESCVERIFIDIKTRCAPERLTVYARYNRRGGLDINPFRSDFEDQAANLRLWRQ